MMTAIAVDDEPLALDLLEDDLKKIPTVKLVGKFPNVIEAGKYIQEHPVDLIFLDIQMPGLTGLQFLNTFPDKRPLVIFITAYEQYAIQGYEHDVVDYLLKPVAFERLLKSVNKAYEKHTQRQQSSRMQTQDFLFVNAAYNLVKIDFKDIAYIEGLKDYVKIFLVNAARPVITRMSMKSLEERLPSDQFVRVHKSFMVSLQHISSIQKGRIVTMKALIPISDFYRENLYRFVDSNSLQG